MPKAKSKVEIKNRRASFDYEFIETYVAGIVLTGTEIKSILLFQQRRTLCEEHACGRIPLGQLGKA